jgi:hypothetical protein
LLFLPCLLLSLSKARFSASSEEEEEEEEEESEEEESSEDESSLSTRHILNGVSGPSVESHEEDSSESDSSELANPIRTVFVSRMVRVVRII